MKVLITGANGQLGCTLRRILAAGGDEKKACIPHNGHYYYLSDVTRREGYPVYHVDVTDPEDIGRFVQDEEIDAIVNCAAFTDVEGAESQPEKAELLNAKAVEYLAEAMAATGGLLIHISTDYVFGGKTGNTPRQEDADSCPTGVYGATKLRGEQAVLASGCHYVILRTAWLYSLYGRNFLKTMLDLTASKPSLKVVFDQVGTPTFAGDLAGEIIRILEEGLYKDHSGIYHYSNEGVCSWYDFAKAIARCSGHTRCDIQPCHSDEFPSQVQRPPYSVLDKTKIKTVFGTRIPYWTDALQACLQDYSA